MKVLVFYIMYEALCIAVVLTSELNELQLRSSMDPVTGSLVLGPTTSTVLSVVPVGLLLFSNFGWGLSYHGAILFNFIAPCSN